MTSVCFIQLTLAWVVKEILDLDKQCEGAFPKETNSVLTSTELGQVALNPYKNK